MSVILIASVRARRASRTLIACFFFFQAEDGIRDYKVTGVQTCALPIWSAPSANPNLALPVGADLADLGAELTPRLYAAPRDKTEIVLHGALRARGAYQIGRASCRERV